MAAQQKIAVVIPCYRVCAHVLDVITRIRPEVSRIYVIDDNCPDKSGDFVAHHCRDARVMIIRHEVNQGVGGAVLTGYRQALKEGMDIIVKIDGDGQMNPELIPFFVSPILNGDADYTKGNRFFDLENIYAMPRIRLFGNAILSFMTKISSGYWNLFDPTNGYTAIHSEVARHIVSKKISTRYFFETDMLFHLNILHAVVVDIPMDAQYGNEVSNLKIRKIVGEFLLKHVKNFLKRTFYNYYLRDMSLASIEMPIGLSMLGFGFSYGAYHWFLSSRTGEPTPAGTIMLAALSIIIGMQFVLAFLAYDISSVPTLSIQRRKSVLKGMVLPDDASHD
jgi:glycosyltransferase involved in cell wall biosynthesis